VVKTQKGTEIKRSPKYGVGKQVGNTIYLHNSVEDRLPSEILTHAKDKLPNDFNYTIVKYDESNGNVTFIQSPDWDTADEPIVGDAILIRGDGSQRFIQQKKSPQIYHHKWLFVNDGYTGFNTEESKNRSIIWLKVPNIEFNKIGYKSYWDSNVVPHINENTTMKKELIREMSYTDISDEEILKANKSSRSSGAVGPKAITPRMVLQYIKDTGNKNIKILDFGSGKDAKHTYSLREMGLDVTAHDFSANIRDEHHDPNALEKVYDIIFASNVLNVQGSENMMRRTIEDILKTMNEGSVFIANFPGSPRYGFQTAKEAKDVLEDYFDIVVIHGSDRGKTSSPVWAMTKKTPVVETYKVGELKNKLVENKKPLNEVLGLTAAILAYRQTAHSKANRLTRKIKKALKDNGVKNRVIVDGNFNKLMKCINSSIDNAGNEIKGGKNVNKSLVKNANIITTKKNKEKSAEALTIFESKFDSNIKRCAQQFKLSDETAKLIKDVMLDTIKQFQNKTFRL